MVSYDLIYRIQAKIGGALEGFRTLLGSYGKVRSQTQLMSRDMEKTLTLQKLAWIGFAYVVARELYKIMTKSTIMQSFLGVWGTIMGVILDSVIKPWIPELVTLTQKLADLQKAIEAQPEPLKKFEGGFLMAAAAVVGLGLALRVLEIALAPFAVLFEPLMVALTALYIYITQSVIPAFGALSVSAQLSLGVLVGVGLGLLGTWVLLKLGVLDAADSIGRKFDETNPKTMDFIRVMGLVPGVVGAVAIGIVTGQWREIPTMVGSVFDQWKQSSINLFGWMGTYFYDQGFKVGEIIADTWHRADTKTNGGLTDIVNSARALIGGDLPNAVNLGMQGTLKIIQALIPDWVREGGNLVINFVSGITQHAHEIWDTLSGHLSTLPTSILTWIENNIPSLPIQFITTFANGFIGAAGRIMDVLGAELGQVGADLWAWARGEKSWSPLVSDIPVMFAQTLNRGFAAVNIATPKLDMSKSINMAQLAAKPLALEGMPAGNQKIEVHHYFDMPISIPITATIREEGKSIDEIAEEVAVKFHQRFMTLTG